MTTSTTPKTTTKTAYEALIEASQEASVLGSVAELIGWDQETMMPPGGAEYRAQQQALLARLHHERITDPHIRELLEECESSMDLDIDTPEATNVRELRRDYDREVKLPSELVTELAATASAGQHEWIEARKDNDFARFLPWLEKTVELNRRKAECYGWAEGGEPWDALAEGYERGCTAKGVAEVFGPLRKRLVGLVDRIANASKKPCTTLDELSLPIDKQMEFCKFVAAQLGFDFNRGRLDISTHPFCGGSHCDDVRMTTRFQESDLCDALSSTTHESGHGIYEQGLHFSNIGTPMGWSVSLGIHESQSRMWENQVGRSLPFWEWAAGHLKTFFGEKVAGITPKQAYESSNTVKPGFIRVDADEATYNMHVMIRFELERVLMSGDLAPADVPEEWNRLYREYLGLEVPDDRRGCLQDVHWSMGAIGYFPTYTLGNLYCAQIYESAKAALPDLENDYRNGDFTRLKTWLNENIHQHGRRYSPSQLCERITGTPLSADPLMNYLEGKFGPLYGI